MTDESPAAGPADRSARDRPTEVELRRVRMPLVAAHRAAHGAVVTREVIIVRVAAGPGTVGWGECSALPRPTYTSEHLDGCWAMLVHEVVPALLRGDADDVVGQPMAKAALDMAVQDLVSRADRRSLAAAIGATASTVPSTAVVGIAGSIDALLAAVAERVARGHRSVKLKVAPGWDVEPLRAVRSAWPDLLLAADANGSYATGRQAIEVWGRGDRAVGLGLAYLEQPVPADDLVGSAHVARGVGVPVALDESIGSWGQLRTALGLQAIGVLNLKPARVGGIGEAVRLAHAAEMVGLPVFVGGMLETGIGRAAALAVAGLPACTLPADLGPSSSYFARDLVEPFELDADGCLTVPGRPGLGVEPDPAWLEEVTVERWAASR